MPTFARAAFLKIRILGFLQICLSLKQGTPFLEIATFLMVRKALIHPADFFKSAIIKKQNVVQRRNIVLSDADSSVKLFNFCAVRAIYDKCRLTLCKRKSTIFRCSIPSWLKSILSKESTYFGEASVILSYAPNSRFIVSSVARRYAT